MTVKVNTTWILPDQADEVVDRFKLIPGYDIDAMTQAVINLHGCGGLGYWIALLLARKQIRSLRNFDPDVVEVSNLNRCHYPADVGMSKAEALANHLEQEATGETTITAYPHRFEDVAKTDEDLACDVAIVAIDNDEGRLYACDYYFTRRTPCIFVAVDRIASSGYVFVQASNPGEACWLCLCPDAWERTDTDQRCAGSEPGLLQTMAGLVVYAVDSLLMPRKRTWSYFELFLDGTLGGGGIRQVPIRSQCPICSQANQ